MNIAFFAQKGGVGKTTSCVTFDAALRAHGHTVASYDLDLQKTLSRNYGAKYLPPSRVTEAAANSDFEYSLFDCPPNYSARSKAALKVADIVIIPVQMEVYAAEGMASTIQAIHKMQASGADCEYRILPTMLNLKIPECVQFENDLREAFGPLVLPTIHRNNEIIQACLRRVSVIEFAPKSQGAKDYQAACSRFLEDV